jgi:hypothetical protein
VPGQTSQSEKDPIDLGQQLEELLMAIEETEPGLLSSAGVVKVAADASSRGAAKASTTDDRQSAAVEPQPETSPETCIDAPLQASPEASEPASPVDANVSMLNADAADSSAGAAIDRLDAQLSALLDEARGIQPAQATANADAPAARPQTGPPTASKTEPATESGSGMAVPPAAADGDAANDKVDDTVDDAADDAATQEVIHQIDELLASGAEEAVEDSFDTSATILGDEQIAPAGPRAATVASEAADDSDVDRNDTGEDAMAEVMAAASAADAMADDAAESAGSEADATPTQADIARELDEQPERTAGMAATAPATASATPADKVDGPSAAAPASPFAQMAAQAASGSATASTSAPPRVVLTHPGLVRWQGRLYRLCATINRPLHLVSTDMRRGVGYAALLLLFNGVVLTLFGIIRVITG